MEEIKKGKECREVKELIYGAEKIQVTSCGFGINVISKLKELIFKKSLQDYFERNEQNE